MKVNPIILFFVSTAMIACLLGLAPNHPATTILVAGLLAVGLIKSKKLITR